MFYANPSIKLADVAYRGAWVALGVEFNFPVSHNWMTVSPVDFATGRHPDGSASIWVGNVDRPYGMHWRVELRLRPGRALLEQTTTLENRGDVRHRFYWWTNAGVEVWDDSKILYPMEFTASHGFTLIDTWPIDSAGHDLSVVGNHKYGPVSRFSHRNEVIYGKAPGGQAMFQPLPERIRLLRDEIFPSSIPGSSGGMTTAELIAAENTRISIINETGDDALGKQIADSLEELGLNIIQVKASDQTRAKTRLLDQVGDPYTLRFLINYLHVAPSEIYVQYDPETDADLIIYLGLDWASDNPF